MRVTLLFVGLANLVLVGFLVSAQTRPAETATTLDQHEDRSAALVAKLAEIGKAQEKQAAAVGEMHKEAAAARKEIGELRTALAGLDDKAKKSGDDGKAATTRLAGIADQFEKLEKKLAKAAEAPPMKPAVENPGEPRVEKPVEPAVPLPGDAKQMADLVAELKLLNERFKRVIDFAAGRSGLSD